MRINTPGQKQTKAILSKKRSKKAQKGITLIALVITIVLNCCEAAMARVNNKEINILKI